MSNKEMVGKIGIAILIFALLLFIIDARAPDVWATLPGFSSDTANDKSLEFLWKEPLVTATLIQGFVLFAALLGINLQFTPTRKKKKGDDH
ncbi:MAG: hypothetical protein ACFFCQ_07925 [Promethearchaeota archaeon]